MENQPGVSLEYPEHSEITEAWYKLTKEADSTTVVARIGKAVVRDLPERGLVLVHQHPCRGSAEVLPHVTYIL